MTASAQQSPAALPNKTRTILSRGSCSHNPLFINTAVGLFLLITALESMALWIKNPSQSLLEILAPFNFMDLIVLFYLYVVRSEFSRWIFIFKLCVSIGTAILMLLVRFQYGLLFGLLFYLPPLILVTGKSQRWRMISALSIFVPTVCLVVLGALLRVGQNTSNHAEATPDAGVKGLIGGR